MGWEWPVYVKDRLELPIRKSPIRFAITMLDGSTSNAWRAWVEKGTEVYVCCRDNLSEVKISLHSSGKQHIAFRGETGIHMVSGSRFWNQWREPSKERLAIPSFRLLFPPWGVRLTAEDRSKTKEIRRKWDQNQVLIEGDDEFLVAVSFVILDQETSLEPSGDHPNALIGLLPLGHGKNLFVVAGKEPEGDLKNVVENGLSKIPPEIAEKLSSLQVDGKRSIACLTADHRNGYAYMVAVPVEASDQSGRADLHPFGVRCPKGLSGGFPEEVRRDGLPEV